MSTQLLGPDDLAALLGTMQEGLQVIDRQWRYAFLNEAAAAHGRRHAADLVGRTMMECYPGIDETPMFEALRRAMDEGVSSALENEFHYPDGSKRKFELRVAPCAVGVMLLSFDVTDRRKLELQLLHAQKMEAVGRLAGSVAHDFNNLLSVILSYSGMLLADLKEVDPIRADIESIQRAGERGASLTRQLLAFSRQQVFVPRVVDLNDCVHSAVKMLGRLMREDVELVMLLERTLDRVKLDPGQVDQVIMNLALNARDAMPEGGKLTIETRNVVLDESYTTAHFGVRPGPYVMLAMSDTGVGMDKETQGRIFEPFFTTKEPGKGTGLGLSTVFGIVQQNHGAIWVYSEPKEGTTFKLYFPVCEEQVSAHFASVPPESHRGSETILLVEDQDEVRAVAMQILRRQGYLVLEARNAGEALLVSERHPRRIDLLLTDVVMPQMNGPDLAERLVRFRPDMRVLFMSGYTENAALNHGILDSGVFYLQKPIVPDALARRVREVLSAPRRSTP